MESYIKVHNQNKKYKTTKYKNTQKSDDELLILWYI